MDEAGESAGGSNAGTDLPPNLSDEAWGILPGEWSIPDEEWLRLAAPDPSTINPANTVWDPTPGGLDLLYEPLAELEAWLEQTAGQDPVAAYKAQRVRRLTDQLTNFPQQQDYESDADYDSRVLAHIDAQVGELKTRLFNDRVPQDVICNEMCLLEWDLRTLMFMHRRIKAGDDCSFLERRISHNGEFDKAAGPGWVAVTPDTVDNDGDTLAIRAMATGALQTVCALCNEKTLKSADELMHVFKDQVPTDYTLAPAVGSPVPKESDFLEPTITFSVPCQTENCGVTNCISCHEEVMRHHSKIGVVHGTTKVSWHCDWGRLATIWALLCGYDHFATHNKPKRRKAPRQQPRPEPKSIEPTWMLSPDGGWMEETEDLSLLFENLMISLDTALPPTEEPDRSMIRSISAEDTLTANVMYALSLALPTADDTELGSSLKDEWSSVLVSLLLRSSILHHASDLLHGDIDTIRSKPAVYACLVGLLRALDGNPVTRSLVHAKRPVNLAGHDLLRLSLGQPTLLAGSATSEAQPLSASLKTLARQCRFVLHKTSKEKQAGQHGDANPSDEVEERNHAQESETTLSVLRQICSLDEQVATTEILSTEPDADYIPSVVEVPDEAMLNSSCYADHARRLTESSTRRTRAILKEVTLLRAHLPPQIYVRHGESRLDVMKILMVGCAGPYQHGLFEFDLFCTSEFPLVPPQVCFLTTDGGRVRFNPNLYENGMVCLSLLGTWPGEQWDPRKSTILQVLLSLQAMVLCAEPYYNEPMVGSEEATAEKSADYSRALYPKTIAFAMLDWTKGRNGRHGMWDDIVRNHFTTARDDIVATVVGWVEDCERAANEAKARRAAAGKPESALFAPGGVFEAREEAYSGRRWAAAEFLGEQLKNAMEYMEILEYHWLAVDRT